MKVTSRVRHHKTPAEKAEILASYKQSGLSLRDCAAQHGISFSALQRWAGKRRIGGGTPDNPELVEVPNLFSPGPAVAVYRVLFPRGAVLEVAPGFQPEELRSLAQVLLSL